MAKDLLDLLVGTLKVVHGVIRVVDALEKRGSNSRKFQEKEYDVEWLDIKKMGWIDANCKNNKKLYDVNGNVIVIGTPSPKIQLMATYDVNGNLVAGSYAKVRNKAKKIIFMDPDDKKDEKGKLKKLYEEGYLSKARYNSLMGDLNK